jgi:hypothetical protein
MTYDNHNNQTSWLTQNWTGKTWGYPSLAIYTYNTHNYLISDTTKSWNGTAWVDGGLAVYSYDANNNQISELDQNWSGTAWVNYDITTNTYDANNNRIDSLNQFWNGSSWVSIDLNSWTYDANNIKLSWVTFRYNYYFSGDTVGDSIYYYFHTVLGINNLQTEQSGVKVYPNPASTSFTILLPQAVPAWLNLYNELGQRVITNYELKITASTINVSNLPEGVYFYRVIAENGSLIGEGKEVIQR